MSVWLGDNLYGGFTLSIFAALILGGVFQFSKLHFFFSKQAEALRVPVPSLVLGVDSLSAIILQLHLISLSLWPWTRPSQEECSGGCRGGRSPAAPRSPGSSRPCPGCARPVRPPCAPCTAPGVPAQPRGGPWGAVPPGLGQPRLVPSQPLRAGMSPSRKLRAGGGRRIRVRQWRLRWGKRGAGDDDDGVFLTLFRLYFKLAIN